MIHIDQNELHISHMVFLFGPAKKALDKAFAVSYYMMMCGSMESNPHSGAKCACHGDIIVKR